MSVDAAHRQWPFCLLIEVEILHELQILALANRHSMQVQCNTIYFKESRTANRYELWKYYLLARALQKAYVYEPASVLDVV
jgi:hypothetical protein